MRSADQVAFFEPQVPQHRLGDRHVFRLAAMRRARQRQLVIAPPDFVEAAG